MKKQHPPVMKMFPLWINKSCVTLSQQDWIYSFVVTYYVTVNDQIYPADCLWHSACNTGASDVIMIWARNFDKSSDVYLRKGYNHQFWQQVLVLEVRTLRHYLL